MSNALAKPEPADEKRPEERGKVDLSRYSGPEKAAIILMCLGEEAKKLLPLLDEEEIKEVSQAMSSLGMVPSVVVEALIVEFVQKLSGSGSLMGSIEQT